MIAPHPLKLPFLQHPQEGDLRFPYNLDSRGTTTHSHICSSPALSHLSCCSALDYSRVRRSSPSAIGGVYVGPVVEAEKALKPLREFGPPAADIYQRMPYSAAQSMADFLWSKGFYSYWKSGFLKSFSDGAIDTILDFYAKTPSPRTVIVVEHDGDGAFDRVPASATAFGHRNWQYNLVVTTVWVSAADTEANIQWTREFWEAMKPFFADAAYVNYLGEATDESVRTAYGNKYERLAALKAKYDPTNFFCHNQNIKPNPATTSIGA